jgi:PAS domain S-box-containing protein
VADSFDATTGIDQAIIEGLPGLFYVISAAGRFRRWNSALSAVSGYSAEELGRIAVFDLFAEPDRSRVADRMREVFTLGASVVEASLVSKDGTRTAYSFSGRRLEVDGEPFLIGLGTNVVARNAAEERRIEGIQRALSQQRGIADVAASSALETGDVHGLAREITELASRVTGVARANVWLFNDGETELRCIDLYEAAAARHSSGPRLTEVEYAPEFAALKQASFVDADDALTDPRVAGYVESYIKPLRITSMLDTVVQVADRHLGLLCLEHINRAHHWTPDEIAFASQLADKMALAITNRARLDAQAAVVESESRFRRFFESSKDGILVVDADGGMVLDANPGLLDLLGVAKTDVVGRHWSDLASLRRISSAHPEIAALALGGYARFDDVALEAADGSVRDVEIVRSVYSVGRRRLVQFDVRDISEHKRADAIVRSAADRTARPPTPMSRQVAVLALIGVLTYLLAVRFDWSEKLSAWLRDNRGPEELDEIVLTTRILVVGLFYIVFKRWRAAESDGAVQRQAQRALGLLREELDERVRRRTVELREANEALVAEAAERASTEAKRRLQGAALDAASDAIIITDRHGVIEWINGAFTRLSGYSADDAIGRNPRDLIKSGVHDRAFYASLWSTITSGKVWHGELTNRRKDGSLYPEDLTVTPVTGDDGEVAHFVAIKRDLTEAHAQTAQFLQAQKMESVGHLAGGIAHDFNNLLTVINATADIVLSEVTEAGTLRDDLLEIRSAGERASAMTRQLLTFSRRQIVRVETLDVDALITRLTGTLARLIGAGIDVVFVPSAQPRFVRADPTQVEQVLINLVVNSRDAMPEGGTLTIATTEVSVDAAFAARHDGLATGPYLRLSVRDTGFGMDAATLARASEPFFTTKELGKGTGLGLSTVRTIMAHANGAVEISSIVGEGTVVSVYFPVAPAMPTEESSARPPAHDSAGMETVLVVDDDPAVRQLVERILKRAGYTVLVAASGAEARSVHAKCPSTVHLLVTDIMMTGMTGWDVAAQLTRLQPSLKVLYTSGYTGDAVLPRQHFDRPIHFISKPFTSAQLTLRAREALDA